jgi:phosphatidylglycerophosphate synthase
MGILFFVFFRADSGVSDYCALVILVSVITDVVDGFLARKLGALSEAGKWLDAFSDFVFFLFVYLSFHLAGIMPLALLLLFLAREIVMYSLLRPLSRARGLDVGARPAGKVKTALQSIGALAVAVMSALTSHAIMGPEAYRRAALGVLVVLTTASVLSLYWYVAPLFRAAGPAKRSSEARR